MDKIKFSLFHRICVFFQKNLVLTIAFAAAVFTMFFVPIDKSYIEYFDFKTLTCLFCVLAVVCALKNIRFFYVLACKIVSVFKNARLSVISSVTVTFVGSMLIANDMALLTFLPLGYFVLKETGKEKYMAFTFVMQNLAANLGGMLTPFGNPQNLYLYTKFNIPTGEFVRIMLVPFLVSIGLIILCCIIFVKPEPLKVKNEPQKIPEWRAAAYLILFVYSIIIVFRLIPFWTGLIVIPAALMLLDRKALKMVDYPLLLTFVFFFIFAGNMARIDAVSSFISTLISQNTILVSALSCQLISNVPSAILLSQFTQNYADLLIGVNIGGAGTLIASLASLITFREYTMHYPKNTKNYLCLFSAFNFAFLGILLFVTIIM